MLDSIERGLGMLEYSFKRGLGMLEYYIKKGTWDVISSRIPNLRFVILDTQADGPATAL